MITPKTIALFLVGNRRAIETIAGSRSALLLAFLFIISAGLARNYDHHILTQEPLWILGPLGMTMFSSLFIYGFIKIIGRLKSPPQEGCNYLAFLSCFAMTAPLAWLYGIPFESHTDALTATQFNFTILLIVSFWRLLLMVRVIQVLFNFSLNRAFALVAIPASFEMFVATLYKSVSIVGIMGGMRLSLSEQFLSDATSTVTFGSILLFIIALILFFPGHGGKPTPWEKTDQSGSPSVSSWIVAVIVIVGWFFVAIPPQQRLSNLQEFRELIQTESYNAASDFSSETGESGFPPHRRLLPKGTYIHQPAAIKLLAFHDDWPDWLHQHLKNDISDWLESASRSEAPRKEVYQTLYEDLQKAPHIQKIADEFTPGVSVSDLLSDDDSSSGISPTISK